MSSAPDGRTAGDEALSYEQWGVDFVREAVSELPVSLTFEVDPQVATHRFVADLEKPHGREARLIDVSSAIDRAWASIAPTSRHDGVTADLNDELEREIRDKAESFVGDLEG